LGAIDPRAVQTVTKIMKYFLDKAEEEARKQGGGDAKVVCETPREARTTAACLAPFQVPTFRAVAGSNARTRLRTSPTMLPHSTTRMPQ
jgi:hypothetical protein